MKIRRYFLIAGIFFICIQTSAQYDYPGSEEPKNQKEQKKEKKPKNTDEESRIFYGGNLGLSFGYYTYIELAPTIGYKFTPRFWAGIGPEYIYHSLRDYDYKTSIYGFRNFASFAVLDNIDEVINLNIGSIFLYAENEVLSFRPVHLDSTGIIQGDRNWYDILLGGVGIRMPIGSRSGFSIIALWGLTKSAQMLYSNPEIRLSIDI